MQFDKNQDGVLTANEVPDRMQGLFARADSNQDGRLTREELAARAQAAPARGPGGDHDHERGGPRGFPGGPPRDPIMNALDANQDGALDARERQVAAKALAALDRDHDGQLTEDEVRPAMPFGRRGPRHEEERH
jgi:Ca2+-binding EF-hand superfamily protein